MTFSARASKALAIVAALGATQLALFAVYRLARLSAASERRLTVERVTPPMPAVLMLDRRGEKSALPMTNAARPTLVHFWATWCAPCRDELPELLALANDQGDVDVIAVSVDESWGVIDHYFGGRAPASVLRSSHDEARAAFDFDTLPVTFLVDASGRIQFRLPGAQPWAAADARAWLASVGRSSR